MSEQVQPQVTAEQEQEFRNLMEHPWVQPVLNGMEPDPVPTSIALDAVELDFGDGQETHSVLLTIVDPTGVKTVYLSPGIVDAMIAKFMGIKQAWQEQDSHGLIIANKATERQFTQGIHLGKS